MTVALRSSGRRPLARSTGVTHHEGMSADFRPGRERLRTIERDDCARLLISVRYGRLATVDGERPLLVVLNHLVERGNIYFRTRTDARLARLTEGGRVPQAVFEVDSARSEDQSGWSVMATGLLHREYGETRSAQLRSRLEPWAEGVRDLILCLEVQELTGRRVGDL
jgi:nitroimidazol reductase NimA-like FMN-containing flavoprotein (pyridoxamine 5'-phosphate oxidase superfamily)